MAFRKIIMSKDPDLSRQIDHMVAEQLQIEAGTGISITTSGPKRTIASTVTGSGTPASTVTSQTTHGAAAAVGTSTDYARADHRHGTPAASYTMQFGVSASTMTDGTTYYLGLAVISTTIDDVACIIPKAGTIRTAYLRWFSDLGTTENISIYIRINDTTDTLIETIGSADVTKIFDNSGLSISVSAADTIALKIVCPVWSVNPDAIKLSGSIYVE